AGVVPSVDAADGVAVRAVLGGPAEQDRGTGATVECEARPERKREGSAQPWSEAVEAALTGKRKAGKWQAGERPREVERTGVLQADVPDPGFPLQHRIAHPGASEADVAADREIDDQVRGEARRGERQRLRWSRRSVIRDREGRM